MGTRSKIAVEELAKFWPLDRIDDDGLEILSTKVRIALLPPGKLLLKRGKYLKARFYLLDGTVKLKSVYGHTKRLSGGQDDAFNPIDKALDQIDTAISMTQVKLMAVIPADFERMCEDYPRKKQAKPSAALAHLQDLINSDNPLISEIMKAAADEEKGVPLPELNDMAFQMLHNVTADSEIKDVGNIIDEDDRFIRQLGAIANSQPFIGDDRKVFSPFEIVTRLTPLMTSVVATAMSIKKLYESDDLKVSKLFDAAWEKSVNVGVDAYLLAKHHPDIEVNPEDVLLGGLIHSVGMIPICKFATDNKELLWKAKSLETAIKSLKSEFTVKVVNHWELGETFQTVAKDAENPHRDIHDDIDVCDVVQIARFYNGASTEPYSPKQMFTDLPGVIKLGKESVSKTHKLVLIEDNLEERNDLRKVFMNM